MHHANKYVKHIYTPHSIAALDQHIKRTLTFTHPVASNTAVIWFLPPLYICEIKRAIYRERDAPSPPHITL